MTSSGLVLTCCRPVWPSVLVSTVATQHQPRIWHVDDVKWLESWESLNEKIFWCRSRAATLLMWTLDHLKIIWKYFSNWHQLGYTNHDHEPQNNLKNVISREDIALPNWLFALCNKLARETAAKIKESSRSSVCHSVKIFLPSLETK